jgi:predicted Rossmann fold nucleotide-binding protein DprA/Smf involved in DNA uptake
VKLITSAQDVLVDYPQGYAYGRVGGQAPENVQTTIFTPKPPALSADEQRLWDILVEQRHFNDLIEEMQMDTSSLMALLTMCELRGFIKRLDGQYYIRSNV